MAFEQGDAWLKNLKEQMEGDIQNGAAPRVEKLTVREFIGKFRWARRRSRLVNHVRNRMDELGLRTNPDFEVTYIDAAISIEMDSEASDTETERPPDPTHRIGMLDAANNTELLSVKPESRLNVATTIMQIHDYSQLPVMQNEHNLKGIVTWQSIGARLSHGKKCEFVQNCMEPAQVTSITAPLFDAIGTIVEHGYVLVRDVDNSITGIVTASDLSNQFMTMAGPFLLIGEIEGHLRQLIHRKFTPLELKSASLTPENIEGAADLTLGDYYQLLGKQENWRKLALHIDRYEFIQHIDRVREIRNDVMHFDPDGLEETDAKLLRDVARFFEDLVRIGAM